MERRVIIEQSERVTPGDFTNFGVYPQEALDHVVHDLGLADSGFYGFNVAADVGSATVTVGPGRLYFGVGDRTKVFANYDEGGVEFPLLDSLPVVTNRIITIVAYGVEAPSGGEPRTFLTNAETRATVARVTSTEMVRRAEIGAYPGDERPDPVKPALPSNSIAIAYVLMSPAGVVSVTPAAENRVPSVRSNATALIENTAWRARAGSRLDTLGTDISALASRLTGMANEIFVREVAGDVARLKEKANLPAAYTSYASDSYLTLVGSAPTHVDFLATVMEGIRFPPANSADTQLGLLNNQDERAAVASSFVLPAYREVSRKALPTNDAEVSINQYQNQNTVVTQRTRSVTRLRYGTPFQMCTNQTDWWQGAVWDYWNNTVFVGGATYNIVNELDIAPGYPYKMYRLEQVWNDTQEEPYWDFNTTTENAGGAVLSNTFLQTQDGWLTSVDLLLTRVAAVGDLRVLICETRDASPDIGMTIASVSAPVATLKAGTKTNVQITPTLLRKGKRYALTLITTGNHFIGVTTDNKFGQGSLFYSTDGAFQVGDLSRDICFGLNFAQFASPYTELQLNPLQLGGGIAAIDMQMQSAVPPGTELVFSIKDPANNDWVPLTGASQGNGLLGLPPLVQFKVAMIGTTELMPGFGVGFDARVRTTRPRPDNRHISAIRTLPAPCKNIVVKIRLEAWRGTGFHTHTCKLITGPLLNTGVGDTITNPLSMSEVPAPDDPLRAVIRTYTFSLGTAVSTLRLRQEGTTTNVLTTFHVASKIDIETP